MWNLKRVDSFESEQRRYSQGLLPKPFARLKLACIPTRRRESEVCERRSGGRRHYCLVLLRRQGRRICCLVVVGVVVAVAVAVAVAALVCFVRKKTGCHRCGVSWRSNDFVGHF